MRLKVQLIILLMLSSSMYVVAQNDNQGSLVKGRVINRTTSASASEAQVTIRSLKLVTTADGEGNFSFSHVPLGSYFIAFGGPGIKADSFKIEVDRAVIDLGDMQVTVNDASAVAHGNTIPTLAIENAELDGDDDGVKSQSVSTVLGASRDPFTNAAAFIFGQYRFRLRGYEQNAQQVQINGVPMNDVETGDAFWNQWGGLNDVFRGRSNTFGLTPSEYGFGELNGSVYFDVAAANQRKQTRVAYSLSNRNYRHRVMFTKSSGLMSNGWAYSVSFSRRWAQEGYIPGTSYDGYGFYAAVSKKVKKGTFNLTAFGSPTRRGKAAPTYQEANELVGSNFYNSNWGYQDGEKRNARMANVFQPVAILNYEHTPNDRTIWNTAVAFQFGKNANSSIDWYNAPDPRPDYYQYLPSNFTNAIPPNPSGAELAQGAFQANPQIKWDDLYEANRINRRPVPNADGTLSTDTQSRSLYVIGNDIDDMKKFTFNTNLQRKLNDHVKLYAGANFISQRTESYRELDDLMGGDFFLNVNSFAERNFAGNIILNQNDISQSNRVVKEGDKYSYHYISRYMKTGAWGQLTFNYNKVDLFVAGSLGYTSFDREGLYRNGIFPEGNASFGRSDKMNFFLYGVKGGVTYKLNGRNYLFLNGELSSDAPTFDNTFFMARSRNIHPDGMVTQKNASVEGGYLLRSPKMNARVVGYVTDIKDQTSLQRFFSSESGANTTVDFIMQNLNTRFIGTELALEYKLTSAFSLTGVAALGQAFYTNNPKVTKYYENTNLIAPQQKNVYIKNYYLGVGPQSAYTVGGRYSSKRYWYANLNLNYFDRNYIDIAADKRSNEAVGLLTPESDQWHNVLDQEKMPSAFTVDVSGGKSWALHKINKRLPNNSFLYLNVGISNLLNKKDLITGGFENLRYDYSGGNADRFGSKYFYGYGRNFFINLALKF